MPSDTIISVIGLSKAYKIVSIDIDDHSKKNPFVQARITSFMGAISPRLRSSFSSTRNTPVCEPIYRLKSAVKWHLVYLADKTNEICC